MFLDLDKFKPVNDQIAHSVARIGGDEFVVVLLRSVSDAENALAVAEKIRHSLYQPFHLAGHKLEISASIGVALYPEHGADDLSLSQNADSAMYQAKAAGRNRVQLFQKHP